MAINKQLPKILAVDDEPEIIDILKNLFPKDEFRLITSTDGLEATMKFRNEEFDLIISDINMPKMNGPEFMRNARKIKPNVPVFFISAVVDEFSTLLSETPNVTLISKPFKPDELLNKVRTTLNLQSNEATANDTAYFKEGQTIYTEGVSSRDLYLVKEGRIKVLKKNTDGVPIEVYSIGPGEILGELAAMTDGTHLSTAVAEADTIAYRISPAKIDQVMNGQPKWFKILLETFCKRLGETTHQLADARSGKK